ncbi:MAG: DUF3732 domain-containing protein [Candidatus Thiodiazotropha endolucinida]
MPDQYLESLRTEDLRLAEQIKKTRDAIEVIRKQEIDAETKSQLDDKRSRIVGRISLYIESVDLGEDVNPLQERLDQLTPQIEELEEKLDPSTLKERLESQLSCIAEDMTLWARELGLEHSEHPIRLDASKLTVVAETPHGRTPLYRMGSGENWVGYHIVTYLALAKWFIEQERPVGRFIFFDQPTQVYFPSDQAITGDIKEISDDEDREAVKRMFEWIFKIVDQLSPNLQVIITDHADIDEEWFQSSIVDTKWRGDNALIPRNWYENELVGEAELYAHLKGLIQRCRDELNYNPSYFSKMLEQHGAIRSVTQLVLDKNISEGLTRLALEERLDLSVEAVVIEKPWSELFDDEVIKAAKLKLTST